AQRRPVEHRRGQRLGPAHPAAPRGYDKPSPEASVEVVARDAAERLVGALEDALAPYVDPGTRGHLAIHDQALLLQLVKTLPGRPLGDQQAVRYQNPWRCRMGLEDRH